MRTFLQIILKMPQSVPRDDDRDETDVTYMADVDIHKETKLMTDTGQIGAEIKHAPGGDEPISVNKQGDLSTFLLFITFEF